MALNGKYTSSLEIIRNVMRDAGGDVDLNWQDGIEWVATALDLIGAPQSLVDKIAKVTIDNYRGTLPCDFESMIQCSGLNGCTQFPMRGSTNTFHPVFTCDDSLVGCSTCNGTFAAGSSLIDTNTPIGEDADGNPTFNFMNDTNVTLNKQAISNSDCCDATYKLSDGFIFTSFKDTYTVLMAYKAFPIDDKGFPLIPDNTKFKLAVQAYIRMKVDYILWRRGDIDEKMFSYSEREWMWYCGAAGTIARTPSIDSMESWKNQCLHLIPKINRHSNFFRDLGNQERLIFGRKY